MKRRGGVKITMGGRRSRVSPGLIFGVLFLGGLLALGAAIVNMGVGMPEFPALFPAQALQAAPTATTAGFMVPVITPEDPPPDVVVRDSAEPAADATGPGAAAERAPRPRQLLTHFVQPGDTLFGVAALYGLTPESVLWSNYLTLRDNPDLLTLGLALVIPPGDGLVYTVEPGDGVDAVARRFKVEPSVIVGEPLNALASVSQPVTPGQLLFVPGGERELVVWQLPKAIEVRRTKLGIPVYQVGSCGEVEIPPLGRGSFRWPANRKYLSGYGFGPSHGGWDVAGKLGEPIYAADAGTVVYAGYSLSAAGRPRGYGQYVVLDHGNGYRTLYAHASQLHVKCGQQVRAGAVIAAVGSVGKSTGPHLHFEIRYGDGYVNPGRYLALP